MITFALEYATRGLRVFPCKPKDKTPITAHGCKDATTDPAQITEWWAKWPSANIGIATGAESAIFVFDIDGEAGRKSLAELAKAHGALPATVTVETGGGGTHYYFRHVSGLKNTASKIAPGLDTRGDGGYVIAPPSVHPSGRAYQWAEGAALGMVDIAEWPAWLLEKLRPKQSATKPTPRTNATRHTAYIRAALDNVTAEVANASKGQRNDTLNKAAFTLGTLVGAGVGLSYSDAESALMGAVAVHVGDDFPQAEADNAICSGMTAGIRQPRTIPDRPARKPSATAGQQGDAEGIAPATELPAIPPVEDAGEGRIQVAATPIDKVATLMNDVGNAARFTIQHRARLIFVRNVPYVYNGRRWVKDETAQATAMAKETAMGIARTAASIEDSAIRAAALSWAAKSQSLSRINAMIELAKPELSITPDRLDADPMMLNTRTGTLDLRTVELRPHSPDDLISRICNAGYVEGAGAPLFTRFLLRIFQSNPELAAYVLRCLGYSLTGNTREQVVFFLYGAGANGKSTLMDVILYVMGDYACKASRDLLDDQNNHPTGIADLESVRLASITETGEGRKLNEGALKELSGEHYLKARKMREDFRSFVMQAKLFLQGNHRPIIRGTDLGFWRRMKLIPFLETIGESERVPDLAEKLRAETDGILMMLVTGCREWLAGGLQEPQAVRDATAEYRGEQDVIGQFLEEACIADRTASESAGSLYKAYQMWAESAGEYVVSQRRFGGQLRERGFERERSSTSGRIEWKGVGLKELND